MRPNSQTPSLARLSAIFIGLVLSASVSFANAQTLPDVQRLMKQGQMPQALEKVDAYISTKPKDAQGRFLKGLILTEMGQEVIDEEDGIVRIFTDGDVDSCSICLIDDADEGERGGATHRRILL